MSKSGSPRHQRLLTGDMTNIFRHFGGDRNDNASTRNNFMSSISVSEEDIEEGERVVHFDPNSHLSVLFQMHGSVWPRVLPYCVANTLLLLTILFCDSRVAGDLTVNATGHSLTALLVSFLIIQRSAIVYARFMKARHAIENMNRVCAEIVQLLCIYSKHDQSELAKNFRCQCAFTVILMLRATVAALEFKASQLSAWDILPGEQANFGGSSTADFVRESLTAMDADRTGQLVQQKWAHGKRTTFHRNFKAPSVLAFRLRSTIVGGREKVSPRLQLLEEVTIMNLINSFVVDFQELKADIATPFPFPLVQMARTFLFLWVFTLPFAMARDLKNIYLGSLMVFGATYGFVGLEFVSMELDDPYGDDPNDFDDVALAQMTFEDIYISILKTDGMDRATKLRKTVKDLARRSVAKVAGANISSTEHTALRANEEELLLENNRSVLGIY